MLRSLVPTSLRSLLSSRFATTLKASSAAAALDLSPATTQLRKLTTMAPAPLPKLDEVVPIVHAKGVLELRLNTPQNLNAFGGQKYLELIKGFDWARDNDDIKAVVVTSTGRYFSAGAAIGAGGMGGDANSATPTAKDAGPSKLYVDMLIDFPKLSVCALQGPAYGITVTTLPLFDLVYATEGVSLTTPFSRLGISLEGCSSVTFPPLFGTSLTSRLLYLADTVGMDELRHTGLFAGVLPAEGFQQSVIEKIQAYMDDLAFGSIVVSKSFVYTDAYKKHLHEVNALEMKAVGERNKTQEHRDAIARFAEKARAKAAAKKAAQAKL